MDYSLAEERTSTSWFSLMCRLVSVLSLLITAVLCIAAVAAGNMSLVKLACVVIVVCGTLYKVYDSFAWELPGTAVMWLVLGCLLVSASSFVFLPSEQRVWLLDNELATQPIPVWHLGFSRVYAINTVVKTDDAHPLMVSVPFVRDEPTEVGRRRLRQVAIDLDLRLVPQDPEAARKLAIGEWMIIQAAMVEPLADAIASSVEQGLLVDKHHLEVESIMLDRLDRHFAGVRLAGTVRIRDVQILQEDWLIGAAH